MSNDWMPGRRADQLNMAKNWSAILKERGTGWDIDQGEIMILDTKIKKNAIAV